MRRWRMRIATVMLCRLLISPFMLSRSSQVTRRTAHCTGALIDQDVVRLHEAIQVAVLR